MHTKQTRLVSCTSSLIRVFFFPLLFELNMEARTSHRLGRCSAPELHIQSHILDILDSWLGHTWHPFFRNGFSEEIGFSLYFIRKPALPITGAECGQMHHLEKSLEDKFLTKSPGLGGVVLLPERGKASLVLSVCSCCSHRQARLGPHSMVCWGRL